MQSKTLTIIILLVGLVFISSEKDHAEEPTAIPDASPYLSINNSFIDSLVFAEAMSAIENAIGQIDPSKDSVLTIIDFSKPSSEKRMFVLNLAQNEMLHHSLVAHGMNTGQLYATTFSNKPKSHMSSLGLYRTSETYYGKHGYSLRIDGLEPTLNSNARKRAVVIHGAKYVSQEYIQKVGRLGRSFGCPALPMETNNEIINSIKEGTLLYIYHPSLHQ